MYHCGATPVLRHGGTGILVWRFAIDVRTDVARPGHVIFHYAPEAAFLQITAGGNESLQLWASKGDVGTNFGFGVYGTSKEPVLWTSVDEILLNNYWPRKSELPEGTDEALELRMGGGRGGSGNPLATIIHYCN